MRHNLGKTGSYVLARVSEIGLPIPHLDTDFGTTVRWSCGITARSLHRFAKQEAAMLKSIKSELALFAAGFMAVAPLVAICLGLAFVLNG